nr:hypothetical protein [Cronobacter turicensis]
MVAIIVFILGGIFIWFVAANVDETVVYTESDFFNYHALTDKDIENAPRITDHYYFEAHPGDGYAPTNSIIFKAANGTVTGAPAVACRQKKNGIFSRSPSCPSLRFYINSRS